MRGPGGGPRILWEAAHTRGTGTLAASAVIPFCFPIGGSEKKKASPAKPRGMCVPGKRKRLISLSTRRDGGTNPFFHTFSIPHPA